jgi:hypothetical protein
MGGVKDRPPVNSRPTHNRSLNIESKFGSCRSIGLSHGRHTNALGVYAGGIRTRLSSRQKRVWIWAFRHPTTVTSLSDACVYASNAYSGRDLV